MNTSNKITTLCLGLIMSSGLFLTNCKKDTKEPDPVVTPSTQTNTERLTSKNFKMTAATIEPSILGVNDYYNQLPDCQKDDLIRFDTPNIFKSDEGATKCNTNDVQTKTGTWVWSTDETIITVTRSGEDPQSWTVLTNDGTNLRVKYTEKINGTNYSLTATFVKQ